MFERRKVAGRYSESMAYTFGDNQEASRRLRRLAEVYEPETRDLLHAVQSVHLAVALNLGWISAAVRAGPLI